MTVKPVWKLLFATVLIVALGASAQAVEFFPLDQLEPGMHGYGRTVIRGSEVESFDVEVLGTLEYQGLVDKLVLVRVGGEVMEESGGIAQGMSGSPVYIDGKLLGALSYGYGLADHFIGMVTPIDAMLSVLELVPGTEMQLSRPVYLEGRRYDSVALGETENPSALELVPVSTPLLVSGMGPRGRQRLQELFQGLDVTVRSIGASGEGGGGELKLEPGSPIAVDLIKGDIRALALGTVTYIDDEGRFLAFGHPFASRGRSNYFASYAQILTTVHSIDTPFKIGKPGSSFGVVTQDRQAAIAGQLGALPTTVPVKVTVRDLDLQRERTYFFEVIKDPLLTLNLIDTAVLQTIDSTLDRIGPGTASLEFTISGEELPAGGFTRKNLFFSSFDIAAVSTGELFEALDLVLNNEFKEVEIDQVEVTILVEEARRTAKIENARLLTDEVYPGDTVEIEVTLRPWRSDPITRVVKLDIPQDIEPGEVTVTVRNASYLTYSEEEEESEHVEEPEVPGKPDNPAELKPKKNEPVTKTNAESLELLISDFVLREKNNQIVAEFYPPVPYSQEEEGPEEELNPAPGEAEGSGSGLEAEAGEAELRAKPITSSLDTEYVIEGSTTVNMEIRAYSELDGEQPVEDWSGKRIVLD
ncbi:MAG: hypothetical protein H0Z38_02665 [Firmicutes bacterium]|nr:hypothetical protein [Bacillota bacterium]